MPAPQSDNPLAKLSPPLTLGIIGTSLKQHEKRVPIHPQHLELIVPAVREHLVFEKGYGLRFGTSDEEIAAQGYMLVPREKLFDICDVIVLFKPVRQDLELTREGGIIWGYTHSIDSVEFTQSAIDRKLTLIAFEEMHIWGDRGERLLHTFEKNNEIAGYAAVLDVTRNLGIHGQYGSPRKSAIVGFGAVGRGAVYGLKALGFENINVFTFRHPNQVTNQIPGVIYHKVKIDGTGHMIITYPDGSIRRMIDEVVTMDIRINAMGQDMNNPKMIIAADELNRELKPGSVIIDASSCSKGIGFPFSCITTFDEPFIRVGNALYYCVDHTPSYLWNSASWEFSKLFIDYLPIVIAGTQAWESNETIRRAIEIREGGIQHERITLFQNRAANYPHSVL